MIIKLNGHLFRSQDVKQRSKDRSKGSWILESSKLKTKIDLLEKKIRLFIIWLLDLNTLDPVFEGANFQVLTNLATSFHALQPLKATKDAILKRKDFTRAEMVFNTKCRKDLKGSS